MTNWLREALIEIIGYSGLCLTIVSVGFLIGAVIIAIARTML